LVLSFFFVGDSFGCVSLSELFCMFPHLSHLELHGACVVLDKLPDENDLRRLAITHSDLSLSSLPLLPRIQVLNVRGSRIPLLFENASNLTSVNVSCSSISPLGLAVVLGTAQNLKKLDLCYARNLTRQPLLVWQLLEKHLPRLRLTMLGLGGFTEMLSDERLLVLAEMLPLMRHVGIGSCVLISFSALMATFEKWSCSLCALSAHELAFTESEWKMLGDCCLLCGFLFFRKVFDSWTVAKFETNRCFIEACSS
jgi:hypothetical protein